ncbi:unnamed protein product [Brassica oleracea var. botrytis]
MKLGLGMDPFEFHSSDQLPFGSPTVGEEEMSCRKARQSLTNHQSKDVEEDETRRR